jgi:hypothetical protein
VRWRRCCQRRCSLLGRLPAAGALSFTLLREQPALLLRDGARAARSRRGVPARSRSASSAGGRAGAQPRRRPGARGRPGQAALPLGEFIARRWPRRSARATCWSSTSAAPAPRPAELPALESFSGSSASQLFEQCALEIGPARGAFTTQESVEDIEALRQAAAMKSSSCTAPPTAPRSPRSTPNATRSTSKRSCSTRSCRRTGRNRSRSQPSRRSPACSASCAPTMPARGSPPTRWRTSRASDAQLRKHALSGSVYDGSGQRHNEHAGRVGPARHPRGRRPEPRAARAAAGRGALGARHDPDPLLRLDALSEGLIPNVPSSGHAVEEGSEEIDEALFVTTTCEESRSPGSAPPPAGDAARGSLGFLRAQPSTDFYPFDATTALQQQPRSRPAPAGRTPRRRRPRRARCRTCRR